MAEIVLAESNKLYIYKDLKLTHTLYYDDGIWSIKSNIKSNNYTVNIKVYKLPFRHVLLQCSNLKVTNYYVLCFALPDKIHHVAKFNKSHIVAQHPVHINHFVIESDDIKLCKLKFNKYTNTFSFDMQNLANINAIFLFPNSYDYIVPIYKSLKSKYNEMFKSIMKSYNSKSNGNSCSKSLLLINNDKSIDIMNTNGSTIINIKTSIEYMNILGLIGEELIIVDEDNYICYFYNVNNTKLSTHNIKVGMDSKMYSDIDGFLIASFKNNKIMLLTVNNHIITKIDMITNIDNNASILYFDYNAVIYAADKHIIYHDIINNKSNIIYTLTRDKIYTSVVASFDLFLYEFLNSLNLNKLIVENIIEYTNM